MKKIPVVTAALILGLWTNSLYAAAAHGASGHAADKSVTASARPGKQIRQINLDGYTLAYHLLDFPERGEMMKAMGHHSVVGMNKSPDVTNHLMVYIGKPDGKTSFGDVAYVLTGPDGKDFRTMTMGMYGGYGADVNMALKGSYTIRTKIIIEGKDAARLDDEFTFQMK